jgi:hypothetical protein
MAEQEALVGYALTLDVDGTAAANNQPARHGEGNIEIGEKVRHPCKDADCRIHRMLHGLQESTAKKVEWKRIREAVCNLVSYDLSYKKRLGVFMLDKWIEIYNSQLKYKGID